MAEREGRRLLADTPGIVGYPRMPWYRLVSSFWRKNQVPTEEDLQDIEMSASHILVSSVLSGTALPYINARLS